MKQCYKCKDWLPDLDFWRDKSRRDGLGSKCKDCKKRYMKGYYEQNKEEFKAACVRYRKTHLGEGVAYRRANRPRINERTRLYRERNPEKAKARKRAQTARLKGKLIAEPCKVCGTTEDIQMHHHQGYDRAHWYDVQWLCGRHHREAESCD